jgi:hypothetical protein
MEGGGFRFAIVVTGVLALAAFGIWSAIAWEMWSRSQLVSQFEQGLARVEEEQALRDPYGADYKDLCRTIGERHEASALRQIFDALLLPACMMQDRSPEAPQSDLPTDQEVPTGAVARKPLP